MMTVGSYEAKTRFAELIARTAEGETVIITRHGKPLAKLSPIAGPSEDERLAAIADLDALRGRSLLGCAIEEARTGGRM